MQSTEYHAGDRVFAKIKGYPYWPARVEHIDGTSQVGKGKCSIFFYGSRQSCTMSPKGLLPYDFKHKAQLGKPNRHKHFDMALYEIESDPWVEWPTYDKRQASEKKKARRHIRYSNDGEIISDANSTSNDLSSQPLTTSESTDTEQSIEATPTLTACGEKLAVHRKKRSETKRKLEKRTKNELGPEATKNNMLVFSETVHSVVPSDKTASGIMSQAQKSPDIMSHDEAGSPPIETPSKRAGRKRRISSGDTCGIYSLLTPKSRKKGSKNKGNRSEENERKKQKDDQLEGSVGSQSFTAGPASNLTPVPSSTPCDTRVQEAVTEIDGTCHTFALPDTSLERESEEMDDTSFSFSSFENPLKGETKERSRVTKSTRKHRGKQVLEPFDNVGKDITPPSASSPCASKRVNQSATIPLSYGTDIVLETRGSQGMDVMLFKGSTKTSRKQKTKKTKDQKQTSTQASQSQKATSQPKPDDMCDTHRLGKNNRRRKWNQEKKANVKHKKRRVLESINHDLKDTSVLSPTLESKANENEHFANDGACDTYGLEKMKSKRSNSRRKRKQVVNTPVKDDLQSPALPTQSPPDTLHVSPPDTSSTTSQRRLANEEAVLVPVLSPKRSSRSCLSANKTVSSIAFKLQSKKNKNAPSPTATEQLPVKCKRNVMRDKAIHQSINASQKQSSSPSLTVTDVQTQIQDDTISSIADSVSTDLCDTSLNNTKSTTHTESSDSDTSLPSFDSLCLPGPSQRCGNTFESPVVKYSLPQVFSSSDTTQVASTLHQSLFSDEEVEEPQITMTQQRVPRLKLKKFGPISPTKAVAEAKNAAGTPSQRRMFIDEPVAEPAVNFLNYEYDMEHVVLHLAGTEEWKEHIDLVEKRPLCMNPFGWVVSLINKFDRINPSQYFDREKMQKVVMDKMPVINPQWLSNSQKMVPFAELATYDIALRLSNDVDYLKTCCPCNKSNQSKRASWSKAEKTELLAFFKAEQKGKAELSTSRIIEKLTNHRPLQNLALSKFCPHSAQSRESRLLASVKNMLKTVNNVQKNTKR